MKVEMKILDERLRQFGGLQYANPGDCGADLRACSFFHPGTHEHVLDVPVTIPQGRTVKIGTGVAVHLGSEPVFRAGVGTMHIAGLVLPRSGLATKHGIRPANSPGLVDMSYQGEIIVAMRNDGAESYVVEPLQRIAQLLIVPCYTPEFTVVEEFSVSTERGAAGFGSTGGA